jgi:septum site-determining protein MinC
MAPVIPATAPFDLKSTAWTLTALRLQTTDLATFAAALAARVAEAPGLFDDDPLVIDLGPLRDSNVPLDFPGLIACLRRHRLVPIAVQGGNPGHTAAARAAGLTEALDAAAGAKAPPPTEVVREVVREIGVLKEIEVLKEVPGTPVPTLVVDKPLRSGQRVYAKGGDLIVTAVVSFGAEVIADGHVHVYAPLRGRAIAGARGDTAARIFSTCLEPQLVSIAGIYRTTDNPLPSEVLGKPAVVRLDGERIRVEPISA